MRFLILASVFVNCVLASSRLDVFAAGPSLDSEVTRRDDLLANFGVLRWSSELRSVTYYDPASQKVRAWRNNQQQWAQVPRAFDLSWFGRQPAATVEQLRNKTGAPGILNVEHTTSAHNTTALKLNATALKLHSVSESDVDTETKLATWSTEKLQKKATCYVWTAEGVQKLGAIFDGLEVGSVLTDQQRAGLEMHGISIHQLIGRSWLSEVPSANLSIDKVGADVRLATFGTFRWSDDWRSVMYFDAASSQVMGWRNSDQAWIVAPGHRDLAWFNRNPAATNEQLRSRTGTPGLLASAAARAISSASSPVQLAAEPHTTPPPAPVSSAISKALRWSQDFKAVMYFDKSAGMVKAWKNSDQVWLNVSEKKQAWVDQLPPASEQELRTKTGQPGVLASMHQVSAFLAVGQSLNSVWKLVGSAPGSDARDLPVKKSETAALRKTSQGSLLQHAGSEAGTQKSGVVRESVAAGALLAMLMTAL